MDARDTAKEGPACLQLLKYTTHWGKKAWNLTLSSESYSIFKLNQIFDQVSSKIRTSPLNLLVSSHRAMVNVSTFQLYASQTKNPGPFLVNNLFSFFEPSGT